MANVDQTQRSSPYSEIKRLVVFYGALAVVAVFAIWSIWSLIEHETLFRLYTFMHEWAAVRLGLDYYMAQFVAMAVTALGCVFFPSVVAFLILGRHKKAVACAAVGAFGAVALLVHTVGRNVYFDRRTGEALRYYADTPEGRFLSFEPGYDPKFGIKLEPYTKEIALESAADHMKSRPRRVSEQKYATTVKVPARIPWFQSEVNVVAGDTLSFQATGSVHPCIDKKTGSHTCSVPLYDRHVGPEGFAREYPNPRGWSMVPFAPHMSLVGRVGEANTPFQIGSEGSYSATISGSLYLSVNDNIHTFTDNDGEFTVTVRIDR